MLQGTFKQLRGEVDALLKQHERKQKGGNDNHTALLLQDFADVIVSTCQKRDVAPTAQHTFNEVSSASRSECGQCL